MTRPPRPCLDCPALTTSSRCPQCEAKKQQKRNATRTHYQGTWQADSARILKQWRAEHGNWCPGATERGHPPHPSTDLTVDHVEARTGSAGYRVLCRQINSSKGANERRDRM